MDSAASVQVLSKVGKPVRLVISGTWDMTGKVVGLKGDGGLAVVVTVQLETE